MEDLISEELEHIEFMAQLYSLRTRVYSALLTHSTTSDSSSVKQRWDEIATYGTEPIFASLVHDRMLAEAGLA